MTTDRVPPSLARRWGPRALGEEVLRGLVAVAASLVLGGLTSPAQQYLPDALRPFANSNGGWTMLAFVVVWLARARLPWALVHGILAFEALIEGYAIVSAWRGFFYAAPFGSIYAVAGLIAGPVVGAAAAIVRWGRPEAKVLAVSVLSGILVADGLLSAINVGSTTGYVYWVIQIALGVAFLVAAIARTRPRPRIVLIALAVIVVLTAAYGVLVRLVLERSAG